METNSIRLGYACINTILQSEKIVNRGCIAKTFRDKGIEYAKSIAIGNLKM